MIYYHSLILSAIKIVYIILNGKFKILQIKNVNEVDSIKGDDFIF